MTLKILLNFFGYLLIHCSGKRLLHVHMGVWEDSIRSSHYFQLHFSDLIESTVELIYVKSCLSEVGFGLHGWLYVKNYSWTEYSGFLPPFLFLQGPGQVRTCFILWVQITLPFPFSLRLTCTAVVCNGIADKSKYLLSTFSISAAKYCFGVWFGLHGNKFVFIEFEKRY